MLIRHPFVICVLLLIGACTSEHDIGVRDGSPTPTFPSYPRALVDRLDVFAGGLQLSPDAASRFCSDLRAFAHSLPAISSDAARQVELTAQLDGTIRHAADECATQPQKASADLRTAVGQRP
jgi:hypothetical protein